MLILLVTLFRWNLMIIGSSRDLCTLAEKTISNVDDLQNRHRVLANEHSKLLEKYELINEHNTVLLVMMKLLHPNIEAEMDMILNQRGH